jgi:hypothetical protein
MDALTLFELVGPEEARDALEDACGVLPARLVNQRIEAGIEQVPEPEIEEPEEPQGRDSCPGS